eukprot:12879541-Alexandrium_andersonii.AAC.1
MRRVGAAEREGRSAVDSCPPMGARWWARPRRVSKDKPCDGRVAGPVLGNRAARQALEVY